MHAEDVPESAAMETAQAIVVGSGFGGAVAACRLAQAGFEPIVLERGRRFEADDFPALPNDSRLLPDLRRWTWGTDQGLWDILDLGELVSVQAAGYGGGSLIYANVHLRAPQSVFDEWPSAYRGDRLEPFYDLAGSMLDAAPIEEHEGLGGHLVKADQLRKAAENLERTTATFNPPLAINRLDGRNRHGKLQNACTGCGACSSGCPERAKNTLDLNYLAVAEARGARVRTQCEVVDIVQGDAHGPRWKVRCVDHLHGRTRWYGTKHLFLCAGSVHSTRLLAGARLREDPHGVKSRVGRGYFPGGDSLGIVYDTEHPQHPSVGPTITTSMVHWEPDRKSFFLIQDGGYAKELERLIGMLRAPVWLGRNRLVQKPEQPRHGGVAESSGLSRPLPSTWRPDPTVLPPAALMPSPLDAVLDAIAANDTDGIVPQQLVDNMPAFVDEARDALLVPHIVDRVIDGAIRDNFTRGWLFRKLPGKAQVWLMGIARWLVRWLFGTDHALATRATRAMLTAAELPRDEVAQKLFGYEAGRTEHRLMLLGMGRDAARGRLLYDRKERTLTADLELGALGPGYSRQEQLMMDIAGELGGELRTNPAWAHLGKPITVHNQGGCPMSEDPSQGVTNPEGQVHGCEGLYVLDGAVFCTSVGVNPAPTVAAVAERNIREFLKKHPPKNPGFWDEDQAERTRARDWRDTALRREWNLRPPVVAGAKFRSKPVGLVFSEVMQGFYSPTEQSPARRDSLYRELEARGRPDHHVRLDLELGTHDLATFFADPQHRMSIRGTIALRLPTGATYDGPVVGDFRLPERRSQRLMRYELTLVDLPGWHLSGYKRLRNDPGLDSWRDATALYVKLYGPENGASAAQALRGAGAVHVDLVGFLDQISTIRVTETTDPAQIVWAATQFAVFFFGSLQRIYMPELGRGLEALFKPRWGAAAARSKRTQGDEKCGTDTTRSGASRPNT